MTRVTSVSQRRAFALGELPPVEEVRPGVLAIPFAMPGLGLPYSLGYAFLGDNEVHLFDTGLDTRVDAGSGSAPNPGEGDDLNWVALGTALRGVGFTAADIASVTLSHLHRDHSGLARRIQQHSGAVIRMHDADAQAVDRCLPLIDPAAFEVAVVRWQAPATEVARMRAEVLDPSARRDAFTIDERVVDGEVLRLGGHELRVLHTPGHTAGHICLVAEAAGVVFTGDHLLPAINPGVGLGGVDERFDPLPDYLRSLDRVVQLGDFEVCPGHGYRFDGARDRCAEIAAHHALRSETVGAFLKEEPGLSMWDLAARVWAKRGWDDMDPGTRTSALAQVEMHTQLVR